MYRAKINVTLKKSVMDPQGATVQHALESLGYTGVQNVRMGKYVELDVDSTDRARVEKQLNDMCGKLLSNPVIEKYHFDLEEVK